MSTPIASAIVFVAFLAMLVPRLGPLRGLFQRSADAALFLAVLVWSLRLWAHARGPRAA